LLGGESYGEAEAVSFEVSWKKEWKDLRKSLGQRKKWKAAIVWLMRIGT